MNTAASASPSTRKLFGILTRKERWGLSWRGWLVALGFLSATLYLMMVTIYPFLAVTQRMTTKVLVVEGWVHEYAIGVAAKEFKSGAYQRVFTTGGPVQGLGGYINDYSTSASIGAGRLRIAGVPGEFVQMVPSRIARNDRTYNSAVALRDWFRQHDVSVSSINLMTQDAHARRSRLLFQKALGRECRVGVIAIPNPDYDAKHWWRYSEGVRDVIGETIAYLYARLFFYPAED